jgi:hypothetical protein
LSKKISFLGVDRQRKKSLKKTLKTFLKLDKKDLLEKIKEKLFILKKGLS